MRAVIAVSGQHGTGKSTYCKALSTELGLRHVSAGGIFRGIAREKGLDLLSLSEIASKDLTIDKMVDDRIVEEAEKGGVILDGQLSAWMAGDRAGLKIFLVAPDPVRFERISKRDHLPLKKAEEITLRREREECERFKSLYGIDIHDISIYNLIMDTNLLPLIESKKTIINITRDFIQNKKK